MSKIISKVCLYDYKRGGRVTYEREDGIEKKIRIPEDYDKVKFYVRDENNSDEDDEEYEADVKFLEKVISYKNAKNKNEKTKKVSGDMETSTDKKAYDVAEDNIAYTKEEKELLEKLGGLEVEFETKVEKPEIVYEDITDKIMFGFSPISHSMLTSSGGGLWAYNGFRKLRVTMKNLLEDINDKKLKPKPKLYFNKKNSTNISPIEVERIVKDGDNSADDDDMAITESEYGIYIDTNKFGEALSDKEQQALFSGYFELTFEWEEKTKYSNITYCIPVEINITNTNYEACKVCSQKTVSIDFGTSSSCVAVEGANGVVELLTLSSNEEQDDGSQQINIYENPTYVMLYRWKEIYMQWRKENDNPPFLQRGDMRDEDENKAVQYDFGYSVKDCMDNVSEEELNAILSEIKMIPSILHDGKQLSVRPFIKDDKPVINLVDLPEKENEENFDAVAFYAYILGRAINNVAKNKIYTKFDITYPVKFDSELRDKIRKSMEYGLKRSLPLPLREAENVKGEKVFQVKMKRAEPVAYIGAICGKYLKLTDDKPELFAVFDFGGGTLDYSFGIFTRDPEDETSAILHILHVDGDGNVGGETLIKRISYWIYSNDSNKASMKENMIPFELPSDEIIPDDFSEKLFNESMEAKSNVRKVNEAISRDIFEGVSDNETSQANITLVSLSGEQIDVEISYDEQVLNDNLKKILKEKVSAFKSVMDKTFEKYQDIITECGGDKYRTEDVNIYKAGNSSKNKILESIMNEMFKENFEGKKIWLVDETNSEFMMDVQNKDTDGDEGSDGPEKKKIAITPKTAVAIGQVNLQRYEVIDKYIRTGDATAPFAWYVGNKNAGDGSFNIKIDRSSGERVWVKYCKINSTDTKIYCSESYTEDGNSGSVHGIEIDLDEEAVRKFLYLRIVDSNSVEYTVCDKDETPNEETKGVVVKLY